MVIGHADGPTSIFLAGKLGMGWISFAGAFIVILLCIPNIIYAIRFRKLKHKREIMPIKIMEQVGWYASLILMIVPIGLSKFGFASVGVFLIYSCSNLLLIIVYWIVWMLYFGERKKWEFLTISMIPIIVFLISGITLRHILLIITAIIFGIGRIYFIQKQIQ